MLKIIAFNNKSTTEIQIAFSQYLNASIGVSNIRISSDIPSIEDLSVKSIIVQDNVIAVTCSPQVPLANYFVEVFSTASQNFESTDGESIQEDAGNNRVFFLGLEGLNTVRESMIDATPPVYDTASHTLVRKQIASVADQILRTKNEIAKLGNANYIYETVEDERRLRDFGPTDRLANEGAFEVLRVATNVTGTTIPGRLNFNSTVLTDLLGTSYLSGNQLLTRVGTDPISLRFTSVTETVSNAEVAINSFDGLIITLAHKNVARVNSIIITTAAGLTHVYDIRNYKYILKNNRYDTVNANILKTLESNQIRLSEAAILDSNFVVPSGDDELFINYTYIDNGINVDASTVVVSKLTNVTRETVGAFQTVFSLHNFPIVNSSDAIPTSGGVVFLDPSPDVGLPFSRVHPAFLNEISFSTSRLPAYPGEYSIEYSTGRVFCFGESNNDGTGSTPPVASYTYRKTFIEGIDYVFDTDSDELVVIYGRVLASSDAKITFYYEQVLVEGEDYLAKTHIESIDEYVENRFSGSNKIAVLHSPITDVFSVTNETTGEEYGVNRFDDYNIYITGRNLPVVKSKEFEVANFHRVSSEELHIVEDVISYGGGEKAVKTALSEGTVVSLLGNMRASNVNTSAIFSDLDIFNREMFYDSILQSLAQNLTKLTAIGDYAIDYSNGEIYIRVADDQASSLGSVSYTYGDIDPYYANVTSINSIEYRASKGAASLLEMNASSFDVNRISVASLPSSIERFLGGDTDKPIILGAQQYGIIGQTVLGSTIFTSPEAIFDSSHDDGYHILRFPNDTDRAILSVISSTQVLTDIPFGATDRHVSWCLINTTLSDGYQCITTYDPAFVRGVYTVTELQTLPRSSLTNYFDGRLDTFSGNVLTLNNALAGTIPTGTALAIDYSFGTLFADYNYVSDNLRISYEYGDNSLDFGIGDALDPEQEYFVSYRYGALRNKLLTNFGLLTQVDDLGIFPLDFNRELYRDFIRGSLASFVKGPTTESISSLVETVTGIPPQIRELSFDEWTTNRDNLYLDKETLTGEEKYASSKFGAGIVIDADTTLSFPEEAYISYKEGTFESWIRPEWDGMANDATLTFDIGQDYLPAATTGSLLSTGFVSVADIYIGSQGWNPTEIPFSINRADEPPVSPVGRPHQFGDRPGYFVWYDDLVNRWNFSWAFDPLRYFRFTGSVTTTGEFYNVADGYNTELADSYVESNDRIFSSRSVIQYDALIDGYDAYDGYDGYSYSDGYTADDGYTNIDGYLFHDLLLFSSDDIHYVMDAGPALNHNRISIYKDGSSYLNFRVLDDTGRLNSRRARQYNISSDISDWRAGEDHFISAAWRFNSSEGIDEMHLGIDGQEVSNIFKFGGALQSGPTDIYRSVASETVTSSAAKKIVGASDGQSVAGSDLFVSPSSTFSTDGMVPGDYLTILDPTADGSASPYTIAAIVGETTIQLTTPLLLTLNDVSFSVNKTNYAVSSNIDVEDFIVIVDDGTTQTELNGLLAESPDYSVSRADGVNTLSLLKNVNVGDIVTINTLGLTTGRCRDTFYNYTTGSTIKTRLAPPADFNHFDIYKVPFVRTSIIDAGTSASATGSFSAVGSTLVATFTDICQPSNITAGKRLKLGLGGTANINFAGTNDVTINGTTYAGPTSETISFTDYQSVTTTNYFTSITSIDMTFTGITLTDSFGAIDIREAVSMMQSENGGDYAQLISYSNGVMSFVIYGSGGLPYSVEACHYQFDFPLSLNIPMRAKGRITLGSDLSGENQLDGIIDQVVILNEMLDDIRAGEVKGTTRTITEDFNSTEPAIMTPQTLMLIDFDDKIENVNTYYKTFAEEFVTSGNSVNTDFGDALVVLDRKPFIIDNSTGIVNNDGGTIEFWISPYIDILYDFEQTRYYMDITSLSTEAAVSVTAKSVELTHRANSVKSVRLATDDGTGTNYFERGTLLPDGLTIVLGTKLPAQNTSVVIEYTPIDSNGDRISLYKDGYGNFNFSIVASEYAYIISYPITWARNTWHRVMATWTANSIDGSDRMRLFIDGVESGTITYGTPGLLYGTGLIYGQAPVGSLASGYLAANIDITDTFGSIIVGNSFLLHDPAKAKFDNMRFSSSAREPSVIAGTSVDLNYNANTDAATAVVDDVATTALYDFDKVLESTNFLANLLDENTPLYLFDVLIDDGFRRLVDNERAKSLLITLINRMKPSHANVFIKYLQDM